MDVQVSVCSMAVKLIEDDESAGAGGEKEVKGKWKDTSSPYGITPGTISNKQSFSMKYFIQLHS